MDKNVSLKVVKPNIFKKIFSFFERLFNRNTEQITEKKEDESSNSVAVAKLNKNNKEKFINSIKYQEEKSEVEKLQDLFENDKAYIKKMTNRQVYELNQLYEKQIEELKKEIKIEKKKLDQLKSNNA